jgi:hypothetical protein
MTEGECKKRGEKSAVIAEPAGAAVSKHSMAGAFDVGLPGPNPPVESGADEWSPVGEWVGATAT